MDSHGQSNLSDFHDTSKKLRKLVLPIMSSPAGTRNNINNTSNENKLEISSKKFKIAKTKSIDVNDEEIYNNINQQTASILEGSENKNSKNKAS